MRRRENKKRITSILSALLLIACLPWSAMDVSAHTTLDPVPGSKVTDASTLDGWKAYFGENAKIDDQTTGYTTEYAGGVWTDKSVFKEGTTIDGKSIGLTDDENFLVTLSTMSSTKQIKGYSYLPTDTVFVLDTSNSMSDSDIQAMVKATNAAIKKLYETNNYNRVGIAIYNLNSYTLMPIDRYQASTDSDNPYLKYSKDNRIRYISISDGVKDSNGTKFTGSVAGRSGTYTQGGMQEGLSLFLDVNDTEIKTGNIQGGTKRIPVMVLMTDGDPTSGASNYMMPLTADKTPNSYRNIGTNKYSETTNELVFLTQLTAANIHNQMETHYGRDCLFYTVGLGVSGSMAVQMLEPSISGTDSAKAIDRLWEKYASTAQGNKVCDYDGEYDGERITVRVNRVADAVTGDKLVKSRYYTDKYFSANDSNGLITAFDNIVQEIIIQSKYYPTLVASGKQNLDGYVTIVDELGEKMEVKDIKGFLYGDTLFTGKELVQAMARGDYGNRYVWTEYGWELVYAIRERLEVSEGTVEAAEDENHGTPIPVTNDVVMDLLKKAWADGQIGFTGTADNMTSFSNYISYYVNDKGQYLGFKEKSHTEKSYPEGTRYIGKSYIFQGAISNTTTGSLSGKEVMYIVLQVYEDVTNGNQTVTWRIPASLVPLAVYELEVSGEQLTSSNLERLSYTADTPLRAIYEVGLTEALTPLNIKDVMEQGHHHDSPNGGYYFYSNRWGELEGDETITTLDPRNHKATVAQYEPSSENERYYFVENSVIHVKNDDGTYSEYVGTNRPDGAGYYHAVKIVTKTVSGAPELKEKWLEISDTVLDDTNATRKLEGTSDRWYVKKGTIYQQTARHEVEKTLNVTETLEYVDYPRIVAPNEEFSDYEVYTFLGNNGRFEVTPAEGLKLTKLVENVAPDTNTDNFVFEITFGTPLSDTSAVKVTDADYNEIESGVTITAEKVTVTLAKDQTVYVTGVPVGTAYTIEEQSHADYRLSSITNNGRGTVTEDTIENFVATNVEKPKTGNLVVTKYVNHNYGDNFVLPQNTVFEIKVDLGSVFANKTLDNTVSTTEVYLDGTQKIKNGDVYETQPITSATADSNGVFTFTFGHMDDVTFYNLLEDASYTVTEMIPTTVSGWTNQIDYSADEHKIVAEATHNVDVINTYDATWPTPVDMNVEVTKNLEGIEWSKLAEGAKFEFQIEKYNAETENWELIPLANDAAFEIAKVEDAAQTESVTLTKEELNIQENEVGTHYYRISEKEGSLEGITYDGRYAYFQINVTDDNLMDGAFSYEVEAANNATFDASNNTIRAIFTNSFNSTAANINIKKLLENNTGVDVSMSNFQFVLCTNAECSGTESCAAKDGHIIVQPDVNGDALIPLTFTATEEGFIEKEPSTDSEDSNITVKEYEKVITYYLSEITGTIAGMDYSDAKVAVTVTLQKTVEIIPGVEEGTETTEVTSFTSSVMYENDEDEVASDQDTDATFKNIYELNPATATVSGTKTFSGRDMQNGEVFEFELYKTDSNYAIVETAGYPKTSSSVTGLKNGENGEFSFSENFEQANTYYYIVKEKLPEDLTGAVKDGVTYDLSEYRVEVVVTPHESENKLVATTNISKVGGGASTIDFINTYTVTGSTSTTLKATKILTGRELNEDEFTFSLYEADENYNPVDYDEDEENGITPIDGNIGHYANKGELKIPELEYTATGTYYYVLKENIPDAENALGGVTYDDKTQVRISVTVSDNGKGGLVIEENAVTYTDDATFTNAYEAKPADPVIITGDKFYVDASNKQLELKGGEFKFALYEADEDYVVDQTKEVRYAINGEEGLAPDQFAFELNYNEKGTHYYVLQEEAGSNPTIIYDETLYRVMVVVRDDGNGQLKALVNVSDEDGNHVTLGYGGAKEFKNIEKTVAPVELPLNIKKTIVEKTSKKHTLSGFKFEIKNVTTGEVYPEKPVSNNDGKTLFNVQYTKADIGKTYTYEIREINTGIKDMTYDTAVYKVEVAVNYVRDELVLTIKVNGESVEDVELAFKNIYSGKRTKRDPIIDPGKDAAVPEYYPAPTYGAGGSTGDSANIIAYVAAAFIACVGGAALVFYKRKKR